MKEPMAGPYTIGSVHVTAGIVDSTGMPRPKPGTSLSKSALRLSLSCTCEASISFIEWVMLLKYIMEAGDTTSVVGRTTGNVELAPDLPRTPGGGRGAETKNGSVCEQRRLDQ